MDICLTANEARIIGCLLEKESTTPDQYPLSLNALVNACNQKSSRDPVMSLSDSDVNQTLESLKSQRLISEESGSRVSRYKHRFCNTAFSQLQVTKQELAIICLLLLRGPQTPGELRSRSQRMADFASVDAVEKALQNMQEQKLVVMLPREAGRRESRFYHLFCGDVNPADLVTQTPRQNSDKAQIEALQQENAELRAEVERLRQLLGT